MKDSILHDLFKKFIFTQIMYSKCKKCHSEDKQLVKILKGYFLIYEHEIYFTFW